MLGIGALATGCGSPSAPASDAATATEVATRYGYDLASATLTPVYALVPEHRDQRDGYARDLLLRQCLDGIAEFQVVPPSSRSDPGFDSRTGQRIFTEEIAAEWGYQLPPRSIPVVRPDAETWTPAVEEKGLRCGERTRERLGLPPERLLNEIESAGWAALEASDEVTIAAEEWRACMAPAGVMDLPDRPHEMPSESVVAQMSPAQQDQPPGSIVPSARERDIAVMDARCREEADVDGAELRARADAELAAIGRDIDGFESVRRDYQEYNAKLDQVIHELGG
ncbi:hypothetical protein [Blastococcus sp. SYSU DS0828]